MPKGQSRMNNPEQLATQSIQDEGKHNMCLTPIETNKHRQKTGI